MKKILLGIVFAAVVGGGLIYLFQPELAYDVAPFFWTSSHKNAIAERTASLVQQLRADNMDACIELTDPIFVSEHGRNGVKLHLVPRSIVLRLANVKPEDVRIDDIALADGGKSAQVKMSIRVGSHWKSLEPARWVRRDGKWYITF